MLTANARSRVTYGATKGGLDHDNAIPVNRTFASFGAVAAALGVLAGAFGAHALRARLSPELMSVYQTAVLYHLIHAVGLLLLGVVAAQTKRVNLIAASGWLLVAGIVLFSGSLYALVLTQWRWLGFVTPFGGISFVIAWLTLAVAVIDVTR